MFHLSILLLLVPASLGQIEISGRCNLATNAVQNLSITDLQGDWYQIARIDNANETGDCSTLTLKAIYDGENLKDMEFSMTEEVNKTEVKRHGSILATTLNGVYVLSFSDQSAMVFTVKAIKSDEYAILFSCQDINATSAYAWAWQYHRKHAPSTEEKTVMNRLVSSISGLETAALRASRNDMCTNKGMPLVPSIFFILLLGNSLTFINGPKYLSNIFN